MHAPRDTAQAAEAWGRRGRGSLTDESKVSQGKHTSPPPTPTHTPFHGNLSETRLHLRVGKITNYTQTSTAQQHNSVNDYLNDKTERFSARVGGERGGRSKDAPRAPRCTRAPGSHPQHAQPTPRPYLLGEMQQSAFFPVTNAFIRVGAMSGTSGRKRAAFVFRSENVIADLFTLTMDHDSAGTTVLHTDQFICGKISNVNCLGSEKSVTWISRATTIYI